MRGVGDSEAKEACLSRGRGVICYNQGRSAENDIAAISRADLDGFACCPCGPSNSKGRISGKMDQPGATIEEVA